VDKTLFFGHMVNLDSTCKAQTVGIEFRKHLHISPLWWISVYEEQIFVQG
jgi:hypothetical protein